MPGIHRKNTGQKGDTQRKGLKDFCSESLESLAGKETAHV